MWKKMKKEAVSPVIGVILMVAITVVLASVLYVWVSGMAPRGATTPTIGMSSTARNNTGEYVHITWRVDSVSRGDVKWNDIRIKCFASGETLNETDDETPPEGRFHVSDEPTGTYVGGAQRITIVFNADDLGGPEGGRIAEIYLVYIPTRGTAGMHTVVVPKAKA